MEKIDIIEKELREGSLNSDPHRCAEYVASLAGELSFYLAKMGEIEQNRSKNWLSIRQGHKSDTAATRAWETTIDGVEYSWYETREKRIKALMTGLKSLIRMAEADQRNLQ